MKWRKNKRLFYLDEYNNFVFIAFVSCNIILFILSFAVKLNSIISILANVLTIAGVFGLSFHFGEKKAFSSKSKINLNEIYIERKNWFYSIAQNDGILFLTGESGIGKSILLEQLMRHFEDKKIKYAFKDSNYFLDLRLEDLKNKDYIILDQFERALSLDNIAENIQLLQNLNNTKIIISVRKEYFGEAYKMFGFKNTINFVWLGYRQEELIEIENYLQILAGVTRQNLRDHPLYSKILADARDNRISLIQLSCLGKVIQYMEEDYVIEQLRKFKNDYNSVIKDFLKFQLDTFEYSDIAYAILYLLTQDYKGQYINDIRDFQNVAIEQEDKIIRTVKFLLEQKWIKKVKDNGKIRTELTEYYEISHDYFIQIFEKLCLEQIEPAIRNNIKYYNVNCQLKRGMVDQEKSWKKHCNQVCHDFFRLKNKIFLSGGLYVMMLIIMFFNLLVLVSENVGIPNYCMYIGINLVVGESIYYMYNYYYHFLSVYKSRYYFGIVYGMISCVLPFVFKDYWPISLGLEVGVVGIIMGHICHNARDEEKPFFRTRCYVFIGIGFIIVLLGIVFPIYTQGNIILACPLFALYGIYMLMGILGHINRNYIHAIVGKTLYGGKGKKV